MLSMFSKKTLWVLSSRAASTIVSHTQRDVRFRALPMQCAPRAITLRAFSVKKEEVEEEGKTKKATEETTEVKTETEDSLPKEEKKETPKFTPPAVPLGIKLKQWGQLFVDNVKLAYEEMTATEKKSLLERKLDQAESFRPPKTTEEGDAAEEEELKEAKEAGPSAIVLVKEGKSAWEQMKERLQDSPLIREILKKSRVVGQVAGATDIGKQAQNLGRSVKDKVEDAREFWETSQNPIVYTLSGVWDNMTGETEEAMAVSEIRKLDSDFVPEEWSAEVLNTLAPKIIGAHLRGDSATLKPWMGEAVYNKISADIRIRKEDGIVFDPNILNIDQNQMVMKVLDGGTPIIVTTYMVQQINCIKNRKGEIVEGSETDIRAKFYTMAFQQYFDETDGSIKWKIVDYEFAGDVPYY